MRRERLSILNEAKYSPQFFMACEWAEPGSQPRQASACLQFVITVPWHVENIWDEDDCCFREMVREVTRNRAWRSKDGNGLEESPCGRELQPRRVTGRTEGYVLAVH